jgi:hypothetical protein
MHIEKRKFVRFLPQENTFAALRRGFKKVGKVHDISANGLSFQYLEKSKKDIPDSNDSFTEVDIFISGNNFHLSKVPCRVVNEFDTCSYKTVSSIVSKRCCLQFGKLTEDQIEQLESFLNNHTIG